LSDVILLSAPRHETEQAKPAEQQCISVGLRNGSTGRAKVQEHQSSKIVITTESPGELITLDEMERRYVRQVLNAVGGNKTHAARILGIDRRSLYRRLEEPRHDTKPSDSAVHTAGHGKSSIPLSHGSNGHATASPPPPSGAGPIAGHPGEAE
jgi:DNA-binding NtrC family response regulator